MKNNKKLIYYTIFIILLVSSVIYFYPKKLSIEYSGIMYRLGDSNYSENIKVSVNGYLSKGLIKGDKFQGILTIGDKQLSKISIRFDNAGKGDLLYFDENTGDFTSYGQTYSSYMKEGLTISVFEQYGQKEGMRRWSSKDGLMISAPANNRNEALDISNKLMKGILN